MERLPKGADIDMTDGTEDPPLSWLAEASLERLEQLERLEGSRKRPREPARSTQ